METQLTSSTNLPPTNSTLTFANCFSLSTTSPEEENVFVAPKRFPVYCGSCWLPIRDLASLKKHRTLKRHFCREYPTSYQKQGCVKKDYRKSWRKERTRFNPRVSSTSTTPSSSSSVASLESFNGGGDASTNANGVATSNLTNGFVFSEAAAPPSSFSKIVKIEASPVATSAPLAMAQAPTNFQIASLLNAASVEEVNDVFHLEDLFTLPGEKPESGEAKLLNGHRTSSDSTRSRFSKSGPAFAAKKSSSNGNNPQFKTNGVLSAPTVVTSAPLLRKERPMETAPSASPFQPFPAVAGTMGGYFTYSKQNCFVEKPQKSEISGIVPLPLPTTATKFRAPLSAPYRTSFANNLSSASTSTKMTDNPTAPLSDLPQGTSGQHLFGVDASASSLCCSAQSEARSFLSQLKTFREERFLTDIFLIVEEKKVYAHKIVLSAQSPFFKGLIDKCDVNTPNYGLRLDFGFSHEAFLIALDFIYGSLPGDKIHPHNVIEIQAIRVFLRNHPLKKTLLRSFR